MDLIDGDFVYLQDVPFYGQGWDMACGYYCAQMLRVALGGAKVWKLLWSEEATIRKNGMSRALSLDEVRELVGPAEVDRKNKSTTLNKSVVDALRQGRPSIVMLPASGHHPWGHYVVIKGFMKVPKPTGSSMLFIVNDPLVGESAICADLISVRGTKALVAKSPTALFRGADPRRAPASRSDV